MKKQGATIKEIAKWAGVSIATVSMVLNHKDASITAATRDRVLKVVRENNYIPNKMAGSLVTRRTGTIGLIIPDIVNPFFPELARGAEDKAHQSGYNLIFCNTDDDLQKEEQYLKMLAEKMVDGIIFAQSAKRRGEIPGIERTAIPMILIDRNKDYPNIRGKVLVNNEAGAYRAVRHLLAEGYRKILFITGELTTGTTLDRITGYKRALLEGRIPFNEDFIWTGHFKSSWGEEAIREILARRIGFDAVFCGNDLIAVGVMQTLKSAGYAIPGDVGVVGFDDIALARVMEPALTTVRQPIYEMGYRAVELLMSVLEGAATIPETAIILDTELIVRQST